MEKQAVLTTNEKIEKAGLLCFYIGVTFGAFDRDTGQKLVN